MGGHDDSIIDDANEARALRPLVAYLEHQLKEVQALLPRLKRYLYPEAYGGKVLAADRLELAEAVDRILSKEKE